MSDQISNAAAASDGPEESPDELLSWGARVPTGVRRLNKVPLAIAAGVVSILLGVVGYTALQRGRPTQTAVESAMATTPSAQQASAQDILRDAPKSGVIRASATPKKVPSVESDPQPAVSKAEPRAPGHAEPVAIGGMTTAEHQEAEQIRQARVAALQSALGAPSGVGAPSEQGARANAADARGPPASTPDKITAELLRRGGGPGEERDQNRQDAKKKYLGEQGEQNTYLTRTRVPPVSPYEVKMGTVIPAVMIGGVNSDLPGQLLAQVTENVWDTATGKYLLIPQGAKLVGAYDSQITPGQERVLVAWTRIVYPDASSLDLTAMPGADQSGYAGFTDKVNNHYGKVFGAALLMSAFSATAQLSQPQPRPGETYSATQIVAAQMGQQLSQLGMEIARKNLAIQPTLEIRPGYRFIVQVTKDMILEPWE